MPTTLCYGIPITVGSIGLYRPGDPEEGPAWLAHSGRAQDWVHLRWYDHAAGQGWLVVANGAFHHPTVMGPLRLTPRDFKVLPHWPRNLRAYVRRHKLTTAGLMGWHLMREGDR